MGKRVKVIMCQDVMNVGEEGDICEVTSGYARNFLIPKQYAKTLNKHNLTILKQQKSAIEKRRDEKRVKAQSLKDQLDQVSLVFAMQSGENGKLFGSITNGHIAEELQKIGYAIEKKKIEVPEHHLKQIGEYTVRIKLYGEQEARIKVKVEAIATEEKTVKPVKKLHEAVTENETEKNTDSDSPVEAAPEMQDSEVNSEMPFEASETTEDTQVETSEKESI